MAKYGEKLLGRMKASCGVNILEVGTVSILDVRAYRRAHLASVMFSLGVTEQSCNAKPRHYSKYNVVKMGNLDCLKVSYIGL